MDLEERIELHIHSKEGGDSTAYVGEIMKQLSEQNIPAVAITNTSNIFCFTEMEIQKIYNACYFRDGNAGGRRRRQYIQHQRSGKE